MKPQKKVKLLIGFAVLIVLALLATVIFQIVQISRTQKELLKQQQQIEQLEKELDYHTNKSPNSDYEIIT